MAGIKGRIDKLYAGTISDVTSKITVTKNDEVIKEKVIGNNINKVIQIVVRL
jgi:hypothetical protein